MHQLCGHQAPAKFQTLPRNQISLADWKSTVCGLSMVCLCKNPAVCRQRRRTGQPRARSGWCFHMHIKKFGPRSQGPVRKSVANYQNKAVRDSQRRQIAACGHGPLHCMKCRLSHIIQNATLLLHCYDSRAAA